MRAIYEALDITSVEELEEACRTDRLDGLSGFGQKTRANILKSIQRRRRFEDRYRLDKVVKDAESLCEHLRQRPETIRVSLAGSLRRRRETVKDIDIVLSSDDPAAISEALVGHPQVEDVIARGDTKTSVRLASGLQVDLRVVADDVFACLLHHFTGSKDHNVLMRSRALGMGMKLNEYGLSEEVGKAIPCADEKQLFAALGLNYIPPELREGLEEVQAAEAGGLPRLVTTEDIRGMLHLHTSYSDGMDTVEEMAVAVQQRGYQYMAICDHSKSAGYVGGLQTEDIAEQHDEIDALNSELDGFHIFKGIECDILKDGSLDYDDDMLSRFDLVVASVHAPLNMSEVEMTKRVIRALEHPASKILAHPTGRLLLEREGFPMDVDEILAAAAANGVAVELNTHPHRLDLDWRHLRKARDLGVSIAVNTDAHRISHLDYLDLGIGIARKGWLGPDDVVNTLSRDDIRSFFRQ